MAHIIKLPTYSDERGSLTVFEKELPFEIKRIYYIYGCPNQVERGGHRHKLTTQALISISSSCIIYVNNGFEEKKFLLDSPQKCLILEPRDWHTMSGFNDNSVLLVLCSRKYDKKDYIDEKY